MSREFYHAFDRLEQTPVPNIQVQYRQPLAINSDATRQSVSVHHRELPDVTFGNAQSEKYSSDSLKEILRTLDAHYEVSENLERTADDYKQETYEDAFSHAETRARYGEILSTVSGVLEQCRRLMVRASIQESIPHIQAQANSWKVMHERASIAFEIGEIEFRQQQQIVGNTLRELTNICAVRCCQISRIHQSSAYSMEQAKNIWNHALVPVQEIDWQVFES